MLRGRAQLGCRLDSPEQQPDDSVSLVLWYKDNSMVPVFSLDARAAQSVHEARHKPGPLLEGRSSLSLVWLDPTTTANLRPSEVADRARRHTSAVAVAAAAESRRLSSQRKRHSRQPEAEDDNKQVLINKKAEAEALVGGGATKRQLWAQLEIESLSSEDNGNYVCRVDFRRARSRQQELQLRIIVPADTPTIRDLTAASPQKASAGLIGPHNEGAKLVLECETQGGYPEPALSWWRDGRLVDDSYEIVSAQDGLVISQVQPAGSAESMDAAAADEDTQGLRAKRTGAAAAAADQTAPVGGSRLIRNRLELGPLTRGDLLANYSCKATNAPRELAGGGGGETQPLEPSNSVMIDMNLRPVKVQIDNDRLPVLADRPLEIVCRAFGSRPAALISWFRGPSSSSGDKLVPQHSSEAPPKHHAHQVFSAGQIKIEESIGAEANVTASTLTIWPRPHDSGQIVTCRAENPYMMSQPSDSSSSSLSSSLDPSVNWIEDSWKLEVHYLPRVQLQLGEKLQGQPIREGQDVYFECQVQAQPYASEIRWWFNGKELEQSNLSAGVIVSNQSLVLQRVSRAQRGHYTCSAINSVGESHSSSQYLRVQFAPVCRDLLATKNATSEQTQGDLFRASSQQRHKSHYGAARMESVRVHCHVDADPAEGLTYRWAFLPVVQSPADFKKQQQQMVYLDASAYRNSDDSPLVSVASYTPRSELDYGTLLCWAQNELGQQQDPCSYQLVAAEPPDPVRDCRLVNASDSQLVVACEPGYDGGVDQSFQMEVYDSRKRELVANVSALAPSGGGSGSSSSESLKILHEPLQVANNSIDQQQDDSPSSAEALSLVTSGPAAHPARQPKQRSHSMHQQQQKGSFKSGASQDENTRGATLFMTEPNLRPSTHYLLSIYSQNSKGASKPVAFTASTANSSSESQLARARFFSSSSSSSSHLSDAGLLSDVLALSWNPFLLVCAISVGLFVLLGSLTFAMMKYVDSSASSRRANNLDGTSDDDHDSANNGAGLPLKQSSACLSNNSDDCTTTTTSSNGGSSSSTKQARRARIITLTANNGKTASGSEQTAAAATDKGKVSLLEGGYLLKMTTNGGQLKQSNSDNFLNQMDGNGGTLPKNLQNIPSFCSGSLQRQPSRQPVLLNYVRNGGGAGNGNGNTGAEQPRIEQLLISGKQYFHQTARGQQPHLQVTAAGHSNQRQTASYSPAAPALGYTAGQQQLMKQTNYYSSAAAAHHSEQPQLCPHQQQLIEAQADLTGENYCHHLQQAAATQQQQQSDLHLAHLRLVSAPGDPVATMQQQHIDSDSTNSTLFNSTGTGPSSAASFPQTLTNNGAANGSPSSGIVAGATPTPSNSSATNNLQAQYQQQQQQHYCCSGSNSTLTSSIEQPGLPQPLQQPVSSGLEGVGGNVISVSDCNQSANFAGHGQLCDASAAAKMSNQQFDDSTTAFLADDYQLAGYSTQDIALAHQIVCGADLSQYSVFVEDHNNGAPDDQNNNQIYLLQDRQHQQQQHQHQVKYPTKARVKVFAGHSDLSSSNYLKLIQQQQEESKQQREDAQLHTDV